MTDYGPPLLAFGLAALIASLELITSKYPRTYFLLRRSWALYAYALIYGLIGFGVMLGLHLLLQADVVKLEGLGLSSPWVQSIAIGVSIKAFLHIRLYSVSAGAQSFPIGIETMVQIFEPWLLRTIELEHYSAGREFIGPRVNKFSDLTAVKTSITANIPSTFSNEERAGFLAGVGKATTVTEAMELYLGFLGKRNFDRVFPP